MNLQNNICFYFFPAEALFRTFLTAKIEWMTLSDRSVTFRHGRQCIKVSDAPSLEGIGSAVFAKIKENPHIQSGF